MCTGSTPVVDPVCPFLTEDECCDPMCTWADEGRCAFIGESSDHEVTWLGAAEIGQTHVVKATNERRLAPRVIAHREAEFLFTPGPPPSRPTQLSRSYIPPETARVRVAVFSPEDKLVGVTKARAPSGQRGILERVVSFDPIDDYSDSIWSVTLPYNWIEDGNTIVIGCVDPQSGLLHIFRVALKDLAQFSEHTITR